MPNNQFLKVKNSLLELEKDFKELKDTELKDRKEKIKRDIEELFYKPIIVSKGDLDKFEEQEMKKMRPIKRNWFDRLIKQNAMGKKPKIIRDKLKDKIINDIWELFETEEEKVDGKKKKHNEGIIKDRTIEISGHFLNKEKISISLKE